VASRGLILVDTKYEFVKLKKEIVLIDEIHTPDSSRILFRRISKDKTKEKSKSKSIKEFVVVG
jgi:phosphoribosylaminoimidazole-succinocarboxamide synthase